MAKVLIKITELFDFSPINREQISLFERDNLKKKVDKDFDYLEITPQDCIGIVKKTIKN